MGFASRLGATAAALIAATGMASAARAQLFFIPPVFAGTPVRGDEPGIVEALPGATDAELDAALVWTLRAGLNVAALQCQFAPTLRTVDLYNDLIADHDKEFDRSQATLLSYFQRRSGGGGASAKGAAKGKAKSAPVGKAAQNSFDQFTTRTYNSFSTLHAQYGFCSTAGKIARVAVATIPGELHTVAATYMREFRNSLTPAGDAIFAFAPLQPVSIAGVAELSPDCFDRNGGVKMGKRSCRI